MIFLKIMLKVTVFKNTDGDKPFYGILVQNLEIDRYFNHASLARAAPSLARAVLKPLSSDLAADLLPTDFEGA